eukprot:3576348-Amphidinium_carterae.1
MALKIFELDPTLQGVQESTTKFVEDVDVKIEPFFTIYLRFHEECGVELSLKLSFGLMRPPSSCLLACLS